MKPCYDLIICMRCHDYLDSVLDTAESVEANTDSKTTKMVFAADRWDARFVDGLLKKKTRNNVFVSSTRWGWGSGLFGMLCESILYFSTLYQFNHFMTIDYDTLFLAPGVDQKILDKIDDPAIGLLGVFRDSDRWGAMFERERRILKNVLGPIPDKFSCTKGLQGGAMVLTRELIDNFNETRIFARAGTIARTTHIADDHLLPLICRLHHFKIRDISSFARCSWKLRRDPRGMEDKRICIFHPIKGKGSEGQKYGERVIRDYFKSVREGKKPRKGKAKGKIGKRAL